MLKSFVVLSPLLLGRGGETFRLRPDQTVSSSLFSKEQVASFLKRGLIRPAPDIEPPKEPDPDSVNPPIPDIAEKTAAEAKEIVNAETNAVNLEKFKDLENKREKPRKTVLEFINSRIKELTGYGE